MSLQDARRGTWSPPFPHRCCKLRSGLPLIAFRVQGFWVLWIWIFWTKLALNHLKAYVSLSSRSPITKDDLPDRALDVRLHPAPEQLKAWNNQLEDILSSTPQLPTQGNLNKNKLADGKCHIGRQGCALVVLIGDWRCHPAKKISMAIIRAGILKTGMEDTGGGLV